MILLCVDVNYYEIYSKNSSMIEVLKNNAIKSNFDDIEYITKENDGRTRMEVD